MARVESEKPEPEEEQNGANRGVAGPTHTRGIPGDEVRWLRSIVENGMEIVKIVALDGTLLYANAAFERILGHDPETTIGTMNVLDYVHPDDLEHVGKEAERALAEGGTVTSKTEYRFRHADGSWRWLESVGTYLTDDPTVGGVVLTVRDVTERREAEEALRESEERFRAQSRELALLHNVRSAVAHELDVSGVLFRAVEAIVEAYGYTGTGAYLLRGEELVLESQAGSHDALERIPLTKVVCGRAVRTGQPELVEDVSVDPDFIGAGRGVTSEICVPLFDQGETVGCLNVESTGGAGLTRDDLRVMVAVGEHVGVAVSRALLHARVRASERRYRHLTQNSSDLVTLMEATGIVRYQSPALERMLGYSPSELLGKNAFDYVHPDDLDRVRAIYAEGLKDPYARPVAELRFRHRDGSWRWLEAVGTNLTDEPGVNSYVVNSRDITGRKEAEERLKEAEKQYRTLVERIPAITYMQEIGRHSESVYVSPQVTDIVGYTPEECTANPNLWIDMLHPDDKESVLAEDERTNRTGEPFVMEYRQFAKDGHLVWIRDEATLVRGEEGLPLYWLGVQVDITERKQAEKALADAEQRYRTLVEQIPAVTYIDPVDDPETSLYTSPQIERMLGYTPEEWSAGKQWPKRLHPEDRERILAADERFEAV